MAKISELANGGTVLDTDELIVLRAGGNVRATLGDVATQDSSSVAISGGTIDGTVIGGSTAAAITGTTITGTSFVSSGDMTFGDNDKAVFGAGSDLQIYHDGSNSRIREVGTGSLLLDAESLYLRNTAGDSYIQGINGGSVNLFYDGNNKLATTSTGIDVTGTVTADGLTVDGDASFNPASNFVTIKGATNNNDYSGIIIQSNWGNTGIEKNAGQIQFQADDDDITGSTYTTFATINAETTGWTGDSNIGGHITIQTSEANSLKNRLRVSNNGDVSLFEDTGTTAKFFWDASAESLGIGTTSPSSMLSVAGKIAIDGSSDRTFEINNGSGVERFSINNVVATGATVINQEIQHLAFEMGGTEAMRIDSSGNVGIGTTSPTSILQIEKNVANGEGAEFRIINDSSAVGVGQTATLTLGRDFEERNFKIKSVSTDNYGLRPALVFTSNQGTGSTHTEAMRIDSSGNLLVGKTSASLGTAGIVNYPVGLFRATRSSGNPLELNRTTDDGDIAVFYKDGTTVGSIGAKSNRLYLGNGDTGLYFVPDNDSIYPWNATTNANRDAAIDLGQSSNRFKDLYLSSGVYLGGTGAANKLDDYEVGTFTATLKVGADTKATTTAAKYVKAGSLVYISIDFAAAVVSAVGASTGNVEIFGLPFASAGSGRTVLPSPFSLGNVFTGVNLSDITPNINAAGTSIAVFKGSSTSSSFLTEANFTASDITAGSYLRFAGTYQSV